MDFGTLGQLIYIQSWFLLAVRKYIYSYWVFGVHYIQHDLFDNAK